MRPSEPHMQHQYHGPPPSKAAGGSTVRKAGGMVVTKYAPPPGYAGQHASVPRPSSQQQAWPPAQQYGQAYPPTGFPQQSYGGGLSQQQTARPTSTHSGQYGQPYAQQVSPPIGSYPQLVDLHPSSFNYFPHSPPTKLAPHARHSSVADAFNDSYFPKGASHSRSQSSQGPRQSRHKSTPSITYDYAAAYARQEAGEYVPVHAGAPLMESFEPLEAEFDEDCYYFEHPEEIDNDLSIGWIESHSALPTPKPLPSTFNEAELEALAPRPRILQSDDCISEYFAGEKAEEQLNTVRLSDSWSQIKDDLIFKEFLQIGYETIRLDMMAQKYQNRIDPKWDRNDSSASISHIARASIETAVSLHTDYRNTEQRRGSRPPTRTGSRSGHREGTDPLQHQDHPFADSGRRSSQAPPNRPSSAASNHSRASSVCSRYSNQRPKALEPIRDQTQDDILAKLGVTGSPRLVYETPGPAFGPPASARSSRQSSVASVHENPTTATPRATSEPQHHQQDIAFNNPWGATGKQQYRQHSGASQYNLTNSEFTIMEDPDATPRPKNNRSHGLKRHYEGDHHEANREKRLRDNEATPKQGRKQGRAADSYGRRW